MAQVVARGSVSGSPTTSRKRKPFLVDLYSTAVGKKYVMAITGLIGVGYVVVHMIGNLKMFFSRRRSITTASGSASYFVPALPRTVTLWLLRLVLIGSLIFHLHAAYTLTIINRRAHRRATGRRARLRHRQLRQRTMRWTGHRPAVPVLAPRRPHVGVAQPRLQSRRRLPQPRRQPVAPARGDPLRRRQHRPRIHLFHGFEHVPVDGMELAAASTSGAGPRPSRSRR